jgi:type I restriction enzyme, S subunit
MIGSLPNKWRRRRLRFDARLNPVKSELALAGDADVSFVPMDSVGEHGGLRLDEQRILDDVYTGYTYFRNGDVVVAKITPCFENGKTALATGLVNGVGFGTTELHVLRPSKTLDARFLFYLTVAHDFRSYGEAEMLGAGGQKRVPERFFKDWRAPLPPVDVQKRIACFLDENTVQIDALIEKKQRLLDRLSEKRQAIITQAVTKGLNPSTLMKDSGIDWLGQIPAHWQALPLRRVVKRVVTGRTPSAEAGDFFSNGEIPWFTPGDFNSLRVEKAEKALIPGAFAAGEAILYEANSVLMVGIGATLGKVAIAEVLCASNQQINAMSIGPDAAPAFVAYFLHGFCAEVKMTASGNTLPILNQDKTKAIIVTRPPLPEQEDIAEFLEGKDRELGRIGTKTRQSIALLNERRAALITAAVTGQIKELR